MRKNFLNYSVTYDHASGMHKEKIFNDLETAQSFYEKIKAKDETTELRSNYRGVIGLYWIILAEHHKTEEVTI